MNEKTFSTMTFGCKVNFYETEAVRELLQKEGYAHVEEKADVYVLNTCAVTARAERKCVTHIHEIARRNPSALIVIMGCFSQLSYAKLSSVLQVRIILGTDGREQVPALVMKAQQDPAFTSFSVQRNTRKLVYEPLSLSSFHTESRAYVKIQDGCDGFCTFCVIPFVRGKSRCRGRVSILREVQKLVRNGFHEIVFTGIDTDCYRDPDAPEYDFVDLLKDCEEVAEGRCRIRISSIEPTRVTDRFLSLLASSRAIVPHIHLPLQSGSDAILKAMHRRYDAERYRETVQRLRKAVPSLALSTDVIAGFPGETEEDFAKTCALCEEVGFMRIHAFPYSPRPFTPAGKRKDQVNGRVAHERVKRLVSLSETLAARYLLSVKGKERIVLFESKDAEGYWRGYSEDYLPYRMKSERDLKNAFVKVRF